jgi:dihydrolipoamide dehydrogenase
MPETPPLFRKKGRNMSKSIIVIGGGPGGYTAAIKAAQLGAQVTMIEADAVGGTCLNVGCIPTKALLHAGEFYSRVLNNSVEGVTATGVQLDWTAVQRQKENVVKRLTGGVKALLRHNGVSVIDAWAKLLPGKKVSAGGQVLEADAIILATGSESTKLHFPGSDLPDVIDSTQALSIEAVPKTMAIVGGGVIGVEFAALFRYLGTKVTIIELLPEILPQLDDSVATYMHEFLAADGIDVFTNSSVKEIVVTESGLEARFDQNGAAKTVAAEKILLAVGRKPVVSGIGLEEAGVKLVRGAVEVDEFFQTNIPGIYAIGDCNAQIMLAHAAMAQGIASAEHIMGLAPHYQPGIIPSCVYSSPEIACVGMTEKQVIEAGIEYAVGQFDLSGNGKAVLSGEGGFVKIIADKRLGEVYGVHMVAPRATEMIAEAVLCMNMEGTVEDIARAIHAHPTVSEAVWEAAMSVFDKPIHGI